MADPLFPSLHRTVERIRKHPQLFWTLLVAVVITVAFIFIAQMFVGIAQDAQERLINVRVGSIQDSLSEFVDLEEGSQDELNTAIVNLMAQNPTILDFTFYKKEADGFVVFASSDTSKVGRPFEQTSPASMLALNDTKNSYTFELTSESDRLYQTFRSLTRDGQVIGLVETTQTLSQVDQSISDNIRNGIMIFMFMLFLVMFLFFRHSRIIDYTTLYEELRKVDQLKDDFISMASHELKTPLTAIRGYSEFITDGDDVPKEYKEYSRRIDESSKQLAFLVEDMLDVSRIEQGRMRFDEQRILVPDFIKKLSGDFESLARAKGLGFRVEQSGLKHSYVMADEAKLRQVMMNIVGNAIKYTKEGEVVVRLSNVGENVEIRVIDTGIGMTEDERTHLFEKFYRIKNSDTKDVAGTGLGLWITKQIIEKMGGTLSVESIKGVGTHMIVTLKGTV
jgi:signal transduction histidine kinase